MALCMSVCIIRLSKCMPLSSSHWKWVVTTPNMSWKYWLACRTKTLFLWPQPTSHNNTLYCCFNCEPPNLPKQMKTTLIIMITLFRIQGVNLFEYFTHHDCLTEPCAAACLEQVTSALCYLHQSNITHLDLKVTCRSQYDVISQPVICTVPLFSGNSNWMY